jgi:riboflavin kinase / FMN adenylyltransferase
VRAPARFQVFRGADGMAERLGASVVAFGKFDGVHRGHRALLDRALGSGRRMGLPAGAVTFVRHPNAYLRGGTPPALSSLTDRLRLLRDAGAAFVVLLPTDVTVLGLAAEDFAREVLRDRMGVRLVVVGGNFRFGRGGAGDVVTLRRLVSVTGLDGVELGMVSIDGEAVSATRIREHLARGDVGQAADLLGRPYGVTGRLNGIAALIRIDRVRPYPRRGATGS